MTAVNLFSAFVIFVLFVIFVITFSAGFAYLYYKIDRKNDREAEQLKKLNDTDDNGQFWADLQKYLNDTK